MGKTIGAVLIAHAKHYPERVALQCGSESISYQTLIQRAEVCAQALPEGRVGFLAHRVVEHYVLMVACLLSGKAFVPIEPSLTPEEQQVRLNRAKATMMRDNNDILQGSHLSSSAGDQEAYVMFTSGSTGVPKAVLIKQSQLMSYCKNMSQHVRPETDMQWSHLANLSFDLSIHEVIFAWFLGATVHVLPSASMMKAAEMIGQYGITHLTLVPSTATYWLAQCPKASCKGVRYVFFCGEALFEEQAELAQAVMPNASILNCYGPTECTVGIACYRYTGAKRAHSSVLVGDVFENHRAVLIDEQDVVADRGVLCISGPQVIEGYEGDAQGAKQYIHFEWDDMHALWYRTGDIMEWDVQQGGYRFIGREDDQWQYHGIRVCTGEIEHMLRKCLNITELFIVPELGKDSETSFKAYVVCTPEECTTYLRQIRSQLPTFYWPKDIIPLSEMPLSRNGKRKRGVAEER